MFVPSFRAVSAGHDLLDATGASSRPSEARLFFSDRPVHGPESDSMTTFTYRHLESMRQPGTARIAAAWRAQVGVAVPSQSSLQLDAPATTSKRDSVRRSYLVQRQAVGS